ncbi:MAG: 30S ribosomal protein S12 methylthiotransferase RimO [Desulfobulbaceae bacterium]|nr:30S ribosomal protein S12 methylthiotransferase RimO [Desulfobulbaceae bacterium]
MKRLHLVSLGCPKNLVDSEVMLGRLELDGYTVVEDPAAADLLVVNTCGFIGPAVEEAIDEILRMAAFKQENPDKLLVVTGCLVQRYGEDLRKELPEVDLFTGTDGFQEIDRLVRLAAAGGEPLVDLRPAGFLMDSSAERRLSTPSFRAYLKVTEGCDNRCTYCMIPSIRGNLRSRRIDDLLQEAQNLQAQGVRELTLIAQDLTAYGNDLADGTDLVGLLQGLLLETDIPWIRLLYLYPTGVRDELLRLMAAQPRILPYLDIPFQHVCDKILKKMNRRYGSADLERLLERVRSFLPECAIRTTLMVGFPGETEADIETMTELLQKWQLDHIGLFTYEDEDGCAAFHFSGKVKGKDMRRRYKRIMEMQAEISRQKQQRYVGRIETVLVEGLSRESELLLEGRTRFQAPEIDGCVYITAGKADVGELAQVRITEAHTYDLVGELLRADNEK